jgi:hypothetical protein
VRLATYCDFFALRWSIVDERDFDSGTIVTLVSRKEHVDALSVTTGAKASVCRPRRASPTKPNANAHCVAYRFFATRERPFAVADIDRDPLLPLVLEPVQQQREVDLVPIGAKPPRIPLQCPGRRTGAAYLRGGDGTTVAGSAEPVRG